MGRDKYPYPNISFTRNLTNKLAITHLLTLGGKLVRKLMYCNQGFFETFFSGGNGEHLKMSGRGGGAEFFGGRGLKKCL